MSLPDSRARKRRVVPRWRSFLNTPASEIQTCNRFPDLTPLTSAWFNDVLKIWERQGKLEDYVDIMDAGIASGSRFLAQKGAKRILELADSAQDRVLERASSILGKATTSSINNPISETSQIEVAKKIRRLRLSLSESPRNALSHIELARLFSRIGKFDKARRHVEVALQLAPDDRYILRSATRFFTTVNEEAEAIRRLRASAVLPYDPWLQSADLAAADLIGRDARMAGKAAKLALGTKVIGLGHSELLAGWISHLQDQGLRRKEVLKLLEKVLRVPTENSFAQSVWLIDRMEGDFGHLFPSINPPHEANEAKSILLVERESFREAEGEAARWFLDQPFQVRSSIQLGTINFVHLHEYQTAQQNARDGLLLHPDDWGLVNLAAISSIYAEKVSDAETYIKRFERLADNNESKAFLSAARGMLALSKGNTKTGVEHYLYSMQLARKEKRPDLVVNAAVYMLEIASTKSLVSIEDFSEIEEKIVVAMNKLPVAQQADAKRTWASRRPKIQEGADRLRGLGSPTISLDKENFTTALDQI